MLDILYRDEQLIAINKPANLLVHRSEIDRHETRFAVQLLRDQISRQVWPVHRLDRGTSGVLLFALDRTTLAQVSQAFERNEVDKEYLAVVRGWPEAGGLIDYPLTRQYDPYESRPTIDAGPQEARTRFERLATVELPFTVDRYPTSRYALLRLSPETGRRHQIRRHLKHIAHPIIGDATHGKGVHNRFFTAQFGSQRMLLACTRLSLQHPDGSQRLNIEAPLDPAFADVLARTGLTYGLNPAKPATI